VVAAVEALEQQLAELSAQTVHTGRTLQGALDEIGDAALQLVQQAAASGADGRQLREFVQDLGTRLETITGNLAEATGQAGQLNAGLREAASTLADQSRRFTERSADQLSQVRRQSTELISGLDGAGKALQAAGDRLDRSAATIATRVDELTAFLTERSRLQEELADRLEALGGSLERVTTSSDAFASGVDQASLRVAALDGTFRPMLQQLTDQVAALNAGVATFRRSLQSELHPRWRLPAWLRRRPAREES
jgi:DNA repair exonuclease SbcCD ATPase subunit